MSILTIVIIVYIVGYIAAYYTGRYAIIRAFNTWGWRSMSVSLVMSTASWLSVLIWIWVISITKKAN